MFKVKNKNNQSYINQFLNAVDFPPELIQREMMLSWEPFKEEFKHVATEQRKSTLDVLLKDYCLANSVQQWFGVLYLKGGDVLAKNVSDSLQKRFDSLMVELTQRAIGCYRNQQDVLKFNKKKFADFILKAYDLIVNEKDLDSLLVYNNETGYWEQGQGPINRLIIEVAHFAGAEISDTWSRNLEQGINDILLRKSNLENPRRFNRNHFPLGNVTLNSTDGKLVKHSSSHLMTFGSDVDYKPDATCPVFKDFVGDLFDDEETVNFVQEWFGYTLSSSHKANAMLIGVGAGANGKSTLFDVLRLLVGVSNTSSIPLSNFNENFGLEPLLGMKLNLATESDADAFKTGSVKAITAGEQVSVNRKNKREIAVVIPTKLVFLMNELPILSDTSMGFERRLYILPFEKTFPPHKQDKSLPKKLKKELEGVLVWSLEGLSRLIENDYQFTESTLMSEAKEKYFGIGNPVKKFVQDKVIKSPANTIKGNVVLKTYEKWMIENEYPAKGTDSAQVFWREFKEACEDELIEFKKGKSSGQTVVRDIDLKTEQTYTLKD